MSRPTLTIALVAVVLLSGCVASTDQPTSDTPRPTATSPTVTPPPSGGTDEPPLDFDGANSTLGPDEPPHVVRLTNTGDATKDVILQVSRDGATVYEQEFRSFPNTTVLGEIDHVGNYTLTVSVVGGGGTVTETLAASSFDCNQSTTTFDLSGPDPTVETVSTEIGCGTSDA